MYYKNPELSYKLFVIITKIKSIQLCGNLLIRNLFSSNLLYDIITLPRDIAFPLRRGHSWFDFYDWWSFPNNNNTNKKSNKMVPYQLKPNEVKDFKRLTMRVPYLSPREQESPVLCFYMYTIWVFT